MRQLNALDAQFLNVESPTTVGHVGSLILLDPSTVDTTGWQELPLEFFAVNSKRWPFWKSMTTG